MKNVLVVIDMQKDFVDGALGTSEAQKIVPAVLEKVNEFSGTVLFTKDTHFENYMDTAEGKHLPVKHCIKNTDGWNLIPALEEYVFHQNSKVFEKPAFGSVELIDYMRKLDHKEGISSIELIGLCTDICVISNAMLLKAALPEVPISIDRKCCAGVTPESHENALKAMSVCQIEIV